MSGGASYTLENSVQEFQDKLSPSVVNKESIEHLLNNFFISFQ